MRPALSNRVVLMAVILICGLSLASALGARSVLLAPPAGPPAVEPGIFGGGSDLGDVPIGINLNAGLEVAAYSGSIPGDISTIRSFMP